MKRLKIAVVAAMVVLTCGGASGDVPVVMPAPDNPFGDVPIVIPGTGGGDVLERQHVSFSVSLGKGVKSVSWTHSLGRSAPVSVSSSASFTDEEILAGSTIQILGVQYEEWYGQDGTEWAGWTTVATDPLTVVSIQAKRIYQKTDENGNVKVASDATPAIVGIHSGAFAAQGTSAEDLGRVLTWDRLHNAGNGGMIESIRFDGSIPASVAAKAYLLNCPATQEHVELARLGFRINSFSPERPPKVSDFSEKGYNGRVEIMGAVTLNEWFPVDEGTGKIVVGGDSLVPKFFKAVLVR